MKKSTKYGLIAGVVLVAVSTIGAMNDDPAARKERIAAREAESAQTNQEELVSRIRAEQQKLADMYQVRPGSLGDPNVNPYEMLNDNTSGFTNPGGWRGFHGRYADHPKTTCILAQQDAALNIRYYNFNNVAAYGILTEQKALGVQYKDGTVDHIHLNNLPEHRTYLRRLLQCSPGAQLLAQNVGGPYGIRRNSDVS